ncbi:hypothetical protein A2U01_0090964, partial [Trifolium medium]|nr:hypothetical protein [Trifolium medium]
MKENILDDKTMEDHTVTVNVEDYVSKTPVKETPYDSIAKRLRTRSGKASVSTSAP